MNKRRVSKAAAVQALPLLEEIHALIGSARQRAVVAVNAELTMMYWRIGQRIRAHVLSDQRARYGEEILATLSQELTARYGRGFSYAALTRMLRFSEVFPNDPIVATLSQQLSWSHVVEILPREAGEQPPLGIILCAGKKREQIELLELGQSGIHVAEYLTALPPRKLLAERLQQATARAQQQIEHRAPHSPDAAPEHE